MKKIKLVDVAEAAGVSKSTVSQFLNGRYNFMSRATKLRIENAIKELNYVPNVIARSLKTDKTKTIGVIVRDIAGAYTSTAIRGMDDVCKSHDYNLIIYNTDFDAQTEERALKSLSELRVDGLIIVPSGMNAAQIKTIEKRGIPVAQFQLEREHNDGNIIVSDYKQGAFEATEYLLKLGHRRICFLTQKFEKIKSRYERYQGYVDALTKHGISVDESLIQFWHRDKGFKTPLPEVLKMENPPTAIFAQHLAITIDLLKAFDQAEIRIADDLSLIGFDDLPMADFFKVPITVVKQQPYQVGREAAALIIKQLESPDSESQRVMISCSLVERRSCKNLSE